MIMKKKILAVMTAILMMFSLSACTKNNAEAQESTSNISKDTIKVVTTIFPEYDWVKQVIGKEIDYYDLTMLLDNGVDLHSYQPTAQDIAKVSDCDLFIYVGGESDSWVDGALKDAANKNMKVINLLDVLSGSVKEEEVKEGMEAEKEEDEEEVEYDEHVWLSVRNAEVLVNAIEKNLSEIDPDNTDVYKQNSENYISDLQELDKDYQDVVDQSTCKTVLFGDRFPFRYMVDDYGLDYYAAFVGCSAESEASFETIKFLAEKVDALNLKTVLTIENSDQKIAKTIVENTKTKDQKILALDSMQSTTSQDVENGTTYLSVMKNNLEVLKEALK